MIIFAKRNLKIFFRDRSAVFFSLLSVFIIIGLYVFFLGDVWSKSMSEMEGVRFLMDSWIMAGILAITSFTTTMGSLGALVEDKSNKIIKDFASSPIRASSISGGYILSSFVIGIIMSIVALILAQIYIVSSGGTLIGLFSLVKILGIIILTTITNISMVFFLVSFFNSNSAFTTASTIVGTLIGFLTGIYLPVGQLPSSVGLIIKLFPVSHGAALFRQVMMEVPLKETFAGAPIESVQAFEELMGVRFVINGVVITPLMSIAFLIITAVIFYIISIFRMRLKKH